MKYKIIYLVGLLCLAVLLVQVMRVSAGKAAMPQGSGEASFLPITFKPVPTPTLPPRGIYGYVTENGNPIAGISVELRFYNGSSWSSAGTVSTNGAGLYSFLGVPSLGAGQNYYVRYLNSEENNSRVILWVTQLLDSYLGSSEINIGNFDVANINLSSPNPGQTVDLPETFSWDRRFPTSDSYEFNLFDPNDGDPYFYTEPLGYVNSYTLNSLPGGFSPGEPYGWAINVYAPDGGAGASYYYYDVIFSNSGQAVFSEALPIKESLDIDLLEKMLRK